MNKQQRYGVFLSIVALVVGLFLHNPFDGYETGYETNDWGFFDWESYGAYVTWLEETSDFISYSVMVLLIGGTWVLLFRSKNE